MQHVAHRASDEIADLKSANALLHSLVTNRDAEIERLRQEIDVLRRYGNKDCTGMADVELDRLRASEQKAPAMHVAFGRPAIESDPVVGASGQAAPSDDA